MENPEEIKKVKIYLTYWSQAENWVWGKVPDCLSCDVAYKYHYLRRYLFESVLLSNHRTGKTHAAIAKKENATNHNFGWPSLVFKCLISLFIIYSFSALPGIEKKMMFACRFLCSYFIFISFFLYPIDLYSCYFCVLLTVAASVLTVCTHAQPIPVCSQTGNKEFWLLWVQFLVNLWYLQMYQFSMIHYQTGWC